MNKILVIGQAPPAVEQTYPYDTTMFYQWLAEVGISIDQAQEIFTFESVVGEFTGRNNTNSGHKRPTKKQVAKHWKVLEAKLQEADKVLVLGSVAAEYYTTAPRTWSCTMAELFLIHPSRRNYFKYSQNKEQILDQLRNFIYNEV